jgi:sigma-54 dependent transcriptional regulator, acetoin dehydrogenase operon transcriptional activator AcoR
VFEQRTRPKATGGRRPSARAAPYLFQVLEAGRPTGGSGRFSLDNVDVVEIGRGSERAVERGVIGGVRQMSLRVPDPWMSRAHGRIERRGADLTYVDLGSSNGSILDGAPVTRASLRDGAVLELGHTFFVTRRLPTIDTPTDILHTTDAIAGLATVLPGLEQHLTELVRVASAAVAVVLHGPSGSGKEVIAGIVHRLSGRAGPLIAVNCGAIPDDLVESELFGHRRGAFSGAVTDKVGLIAAADGGTLFLDEIGDLPVAAQPALLRALQERAVRPVGATAAVPVDFRVISATHRDLEVMVRMGGFREDLWARLAGFTFEVPPLAERREDLGTLVAHLLGRHGGGRDIALTADAARALIRYGWPRNVRELEKALEAGIALAGDGDLDVHHLPPAIGDGVPRSGAHPVAPDDSIDAPPIDDPRRDALIAALREHQGNVSAAARALGKPRSQIQRWIRRWGLRAADGDGDE